MIDIKHSIPITEAHQSRKIRAKGCGDVESGRRLGDDVRAISGKFFSICLTVLAGIVLAIMGAQFMSGAAVETSASSLSFGIAGQGGADGVTAVLRDDQWG